MPADQPTTPNHFLRSLIERIVRSFIAGAASTYVTLSAVLDVDGKAHTWQFLLGGCFSGGVTAVLGLLAKPFGNPDSPSVLPPDDHVVIEPTITAAQLAEAIAGVRTEMAALPAQAPPPAPAAVPTPTPAPAPVAPVAGSVPAQYVGDPWDLTTEVLPAPPPPLDDGDDYDEEFDPGPQPGDPTPRIAGVG